jgi:hypothetical protein
LCGSGKLFGIVARTMTVIPQERQMTRGQRERDEARIAELIELGVTKADLWRYYSDRADSLAEQLWTTGTWMLGIIAAVLSLPFVAKFIVVDPTNLIKFESRTLTIVVCVLGILLCVYFYTVITDIREHLQRNWERSDLARTGKWEKSNWGGLKFRGWGILIAFGGWALLGFVGLSVLAVLWK